jgi:hypothetical protein
MFQQLLLAAFTMQEHNDRVLKSPGFDGAYLSPMGIVEMVKSIRLERLAPHHDFLIPPETAYQLSLLASQLEAVVQREVRPDPEGATSQGANGGEQPSVGNSAEDRGPLALEQPGQPESNQLAPLERDVVPTRTSVFHRKSVPSRNALPDDPFWRTATVFAVAAILSLFMGASVHRLSPLPAVLSAPSEGVQQEAPLRSSVPVVYDQKPIMAPDRIDSTYESEADLVAEDTVIRYTRHASGVKPPRKR